MPHPSHEKQKQRNAFFDNAKYLAIVLVAVAHAWEPVMDGSRTTRALYMVVYTFHMPAFVIVSGYFSRSFAGRPDQMRRLVSGVLVPYAVFEAAYSLLRRWAGGEPEHPLSLTDPFYLTWFLAALFVWRLTVPLWRALRHPLPVAVAVAAAASCAPGVGADLDLQRVLQFLPFFVLGLVLREEHVLLLRRPAVRAAAVPVVLVAVAVAYAVAPRLRLGWFFRTSAAQELDAPWWSGPVMTLALGGCALVLTAAFLAWVPERRLWCTALGAGSVCGYLLHGFPLKALEYGGAVEAYPVLASPAGRIALTAAAAAVVTLLCTGPVRRALRCVTEPRLAWAFRPAPPPAVPDPRPAGPAGAGRSPGAAPAPAAVSRR